MGGLLGEILAFVAIKVLQGLWARHDLKETVRKDIALAAHEINRKAVAWYVGHPDGGAPLLVRPGAEPLGPARPDAGAPGGAGGDGLSPGS